MKRLLLILFLLMWNSVAQATVALDSINTGYLDTTKGGMGANMTPAGAGYVPESTGVGAWGLTSTSNFLLTGDTLNLTFTANSLIWFNNSGVATAIPLGATNTVLTGNGTTSAPTFQTPSGGSMTYPGTGIAVSTGSSWGTSLTAPSSAIDGISDTHTLSNKTLLDPLYTDYSSSSSSGWTISLANGSVQDLTMSGSGTITLPASTAGQDYTLRLHYGGAYTPTWAGGSTLVWPGNTTPTPTAANGKTDIFHFSCDGTYTYGNVLGLNYTASGAFSCSGSPFLTQALNQNQGTIGGTLYYAGMVYTGTGTFSTCAIDVSLNTTNNLTGDTVYVEIWNYNTGSQVLSSKVASVTSIPATTLPASGSIHIAFGSEISLSQNQALVFTFNSSGVPLYSAGINYSSTQPISTQLFGQWYSNGAPAITPVDNLTANYY